MTLSPDDPWYIRSPDLQTDDPARQRYERALTLSRMRRFVERYDDPIRWPHYAERVAYRKMCLEHWQEYLDGTIVPSRHYKPGARRRSATPKGSRYVVWNVTLPPDLSQRLMAHLGKDETKSALITRLLEQVV